MNILVIVVMGVIWMVGHIVKATKTKAGDAQQPGRKTPAHGGGGRQQTPVRAQQRPTGPAQRPDQLLGAPKKRTMLADLRAAARKFAAEAEQAFQVQTPMPTPKPPKPASKPQIQPVVAMIKGLADKQTATAEMLPTQYLSDLLSDYADPDKLKKAILHYEILGPPLSLRD